MQYQKGEGKKRGGFLIQIGTWEEKKKNLVNW